MNCKTITIVLLLAIIPSFLFAESGPRITFNELEHDLGNVNHGETSSIEIPLLNTGNQNLTIKRLRSSCGCAKAVKGSKLVAPGQSTKIEAKIDTYGMGPGLHSKSIYVYTNDPNHPKTRLKLTFNVIRHVTISPSYLSKVLKTFNNEVIFPVKATNHWNKPISLQAQQTNCSDGDPTLAPQKVVVPPGAKVDFEIRIPIDPKNGKKYVKGTAMIETNDPIDETLRVHYMIRLPPKEGA